MVMSLYPLFLVVTVAAPGDDTAPRSRAAAVR